MQASDHIHEGEISALNRLGAERMDNLMWKEFRVRLLRNMGLVSVPRSRQQYTASMPDFIWFLRVLGFLLDISASNMVWLNWISAQCPSQDNAVLV